MHNKEIIFDSLFTGNLSNLQHTQFLKELTAKHPYFSPAQFFLLQNIKEDSEAFKKQTVKTNILFNNAHWLNFKLQQINHVASKLKNNNEAPQHTTTTTTTLDSTEEFINDTEAKGDMEQEIEPMKIELKMPVEKVNLDEALLFEPMHVVDYFASQGIKLPAEVQSGDKLGKQLKSFTDWLKTMKKVHAEIDLQITETKVADIQSLAEISNEDAEILTESMAEIFIKQNKLNKATEVYQKLSLLNPTKSAYFVAKIDNLKEI